MRFETPQDAEDAYYDALEAGDALAMTDLWEASDKIACLLPMTPLALGREVPRLWRAVFEQGARFNLQVRHIAWIDNGDLAIHLIEERSLVDEPAGGQSPGPELPAIYGINVFRRGPEGWRLLLHQNAPSPPPPPGTPTSRRTALA